MYRTNLRLLILLFFIPMQLLAQREAELNVIRRMMTACDQIKTASFILSTEERNKKGTIEKGEMFVKLNHTPLKMYISIYQPNAGVELLYREGEINDDLLVNPNGFPFFNLKFAMNNLNVRKNSHHEVKHICFDHLSGLIRHYLDKMGGQLGSYLAPADTVDWERHRCIRIEFDYPQFGYTEHIAAAGEDAVSIGRQFYVNDYMIVCANPEVSDIHDVQVGEKLRVPNMFGRKIIFLIDLNTMLPLVQEIHDEKGLYERYEYRSFVLNPGFKPEEFTPEYEGYGF